MTQGFDVDALVAELEPVRPLSWRRGAILPVLLCLAGAVLIVWKSGMRADLLAGDPHPMFLLRGGILLLLGGVSALTVLMMASPGVGKAGNGWKIALAAAALFPLSALILGLSGQPLDAFSQTSSGLICLRNSLLVGATTAVPMVLWLRKGAPVSPTRAGWLTGISAGGLGAFAYGFHCPFNSVIYIGLWYGLAVTAGAVIGRLIVPPLIRW